MIFGLTGGIACGKSTVTKTFLKHGIPMVDADQLARSVVEVGTIGYEMLLSYFGPEYFINYKLDRPKLGELAFKDPTALKFLNATVGVLIEEEASLQFAKLKSEGHSLIGYDAALICERGNSHKYQPLIVVGCKPEIQLQRLMSRNNLTEAQAIARISAQMPTQKKLEMAHYSIDTSGTIEESIEQTEQIIEILRR